MSLPHVMTPLSLPQGRPDISHCRVPELRKMATFWGVPNAGKLPVTPCRAALERAWRDETMAQEAARSLRGDGRTVLSVFRRHGGAVHGEVLRLDLLARGVLRFKEDPMPFGRPWRRWTNNPVPTLVERGALILLDSSRGGHYFSHSSTEVEKPFLTYRLHPALMKWIDPAGPPPWRIPGREAREVQPLPGPPPAQTALYLRRLAAQLATHLVATLAKRGGISPSTRAALAKAVPIPTDTDFPLPSPQGLGVELLRTAGALVQDGPDRLVANPAATARLFDMPSLHQVHAWARGWLHCRGWLDGKGDMAVEDSWYGGPQTERQVLTWYLSALAHKDRPWVDLERFLFTVHEEHVSSNLSSWGAGGWDPDFPAARDKENKKDEERRLAWWLANEGRWYANALMVTLPWLGVVERGRCAGGKEPSWAFRLTPLGQAVFAAPEAVPEPPRTEERFLVVQPNFDVVAYLDRADFGTAATLGSLTESEPRKTAAAAPVQTVRLTPTSVYLALENGMTESQIIEFLEQHTQNELPANVVQSLREWSAKRENITVREGASFIAFPTPEEAARYLSREKGELLGDRVVLLGGQRAGKVPAGALSLDHDRGNRRSWTVDEQGLVQGSASGDLVQSARLWRIADETRTGWQLTRASITRAMQAGLKVKDVRFWLEEHLTSPLPTVIAQALSAWASKPMPAGLAEAVVLHLPVTEQFEAVLRSERSRPYILHSPGPGWLLVHREKRKQLAALLEELGFAVGPDLLLS